MPSLRGLRHAKSNRGRFPFQKEGGEDLDSRCPMDRGGPFLHPVDERENGILAQNNGGMRSLPSEPRGFLHKRRAGQRDQEREKLPVARKKKNCLDKRRESLKKKSKYRLRKIKREWIKLNAKLKESVGSRRVQAVRELKYWLEIGWERGSSVVRSK